MPVYQEVTIVEGDGPLPPSRVSVKYKHCCGNIDNQRKAMVVRRYIANKIHEVLSRKKISKLHALVNFFKKK